MSKKNSNKTEESIELINLFGEKEVWLRKNDFLEGKECDNIKEILLYDEEDIFE